ncbi:Rhodanese-like domain-containing protein [Pterulicium gracile]|uniref:Rhodanese-like domain-containing protein n=1 Tax=Pterulicium gracile TaxID=1884261 RepID=A0A5C3Q6U7_9AGAR|nr:Rhodanese-like domain-containing protein [Pterula gracilis]
MTEQPWHAAFPQPNPKTPVHSITPADLAAKLRAGEGTTHKLLVVDVRRTDFENAAIHSAVNAPAHSLYPTLRPGLLKMFSAFESVVFHCNSCSPGGRGDRCARWYQEAVDEAGLNDRTKALVLQGGIKAWVAEYGDDEEVTLKL